jgi:RNA polymerase sigma-70 factor (ECF subfamily)
MRTLKARPVPSLPPDFEAIYEAHVDFVWRNLRRLGVPPSQVDDACQDVFLVVHRRLKDFAGKSTVRTWLFGIALRVASEHRRKLRRTDAFDVPLEEIEGGGPSPLEAAERQQAAALLEQFLEVMPEMHRPVFILAELEQMTAPEIADALDLNLNTVYSRLRLGRQAFDQAVAAWQARRPR